ncbi:MAG: hypothetical protein ACRD2W_03725 [Acidimicrobiales bacterium]
MPPLPTAAWIVVLEFSAPEQPDAQPTISQVVELLESLDHCDPVSLYDIDRCAVQIQVEGSTAARALAHAVAKHQRSVARLGLSPLPLVRADVMTPDELARDLDTATATTSEGWTLPASGQN